MPRSSELESLAPIAPDQRTWRARHFSLLWLNAIVTPSSIITGSSLLSVGLRWYEILLALGLATAVLFLALLANAAPGTRYGIPFPVYARAAFGSAGAVGVALSRGVVAIFWCSLQVWLGTKALYSAAVAFDPSIAAASPVVVEGRLNVAELAIFLSFLALHVVLAVAMGPERLRWLFYVAGPVQVIGLAGLLGWALSVANVDQLLAASLNISDAAAAERGGTGPVGLAWWRGVTAAVSGWSTMVLNIADLSRYAKSQKAQVWGQSLAFPLLNVCTPFVGVLAAGAASLAYGPEAATWDLVDLFQRWPPGWALVGAIAVAFALLTCNLIANVVSPANDIANVAPDRISFRVGAVASLVGVALCQPWSLFATADNFIERFLVGYSMVTGGIFGVMVTDYYLVRHRLLDVASLYFYAASPSYSYSSSDGGSGHGSGAIAVDADAQTSTIQDIGGWQSAAAGGTSLSPPKRCRWHASVAIFLGAAPCVPFFVAQFINAPPSSPPLPDGGIWDVLYSSSWFVSCILASLIYYLVERRGSSLQRRWCSVRDARGDDDIAQRAPGGYKKLSLLSETERLHDQNQRSCD